MKREKRLVADLFWKLRFLALGQGQRQDRKTHDDRDQIVGNVACRCQGGDDGVRHDLSRHVDQAVNAEDASPDVVRDLRLKPAFDQRVAPCHRETGQHPDRRPEHRIRDKRMGDDRYHGRACHDGEGPRMSGTPYEMGAKYAAKEEAGEMSGSQKPDFNR